MAYQEKWEGFEEIDDTFSSSDLPVIAGEDSNAKDDFEFQVTAAGGLLWSSAEADMCVADEVFFQGRILPLWPSVRSDKGFFATSPRRSGSRSSSDSSDRHSTTTSRSSSSNSSNSSRASLYNIFYTHPSPMPWYRAERKANAERRSASPAPPGWGIFRLGVAMAPEIELYEMRARRSSSVTKNNPVTEHAKKAVKGTRSDVVRGNATKTQKKAPPPPARRGLNCKCSPDAVEPIAMSKLGTISKKKNGEASLRRGERDHHVQELRL